ncbi:MAG TPA: NAD-dependent epimerase/dehydratase family protein [Aridibacter sp.]|nr:NAD-dependent epimerase/dehydratase family protein [Aridibacter sp.]
MEKILVTGGSGLVGSHLKRFLPDASYISSSDFDLTRETDVKRLFDTKWGRVIHLAGRVGGILENIRHPAEFIEENLLLNTLLLRYARLSEVPRFTALLSTCIYPDVTESYPMTEADLNQGPPQETNFAYAISKIAMAAQIDAYNKQYSTRYNYLIPSNLFGEHDRVNLEKSHFLTALLGKILKAEQNGESSVRLLGTGKPLRQFLHADDLCGVIRQCVDQDITGSFNVAPDENLSIREIAGIAVDVCTGGRLTIEFDNDSPDGQFRKDVSNERMKKALGEFEFTPLREGIARVYAHYREHNAI